MHLGRAALGVILGALWVAGPLAVAASDKDPADEIVQKNLFSPGRAPAKPPQPPKVTTVAQPKAPPPEPPPAFTLYGVILVDKEPPQALLEEPRLTGGRSRFVGLGDQVGSYVVTAIEPERVLLQKDGSSVTVNLLDPGNPKKQTTTARPVVAAPAAPVSRTPPAPPAAGQGARPERPPQGNRDEMRAEQMQRMQQFREQLMQGRGAQGGAQGVMPGRLGRPPLRGGGEGAAPGAGTTPDPGVAPGTGATSGQESGSLADIFQRAFQQPGSTGAAGTPDQPEQPEQK